MIAWQQDFAVYFLLPNSLRYSAGMATRLKTPGIHLGGAIACLVAAAVIAGVVYFAGPMPMLHDVASVARMPIPGTEDVDLAAGNYGLYFGALNAPTGKVMGVPPLDITIVPPATVADPDFVSVPIDTDVFVDGYHTVQVAHITVTTPGVYHVHVESHEENGGSFSIGDMPAIISPGRNVLRATPFIALFILLGLVLGLTALRARSRAAQVETRQIDR